MNNEPPEEETALELQEKQEQQLRERRIIASKNRAIEPALESLADEVERRKASGQLAKEMKKLKVSSLLGNLTRIVAAIKSVAPVVVAVGQRPARDSYWHRENSAVRISSSERERRRKIVDAEVVEKTEAKQEKQ